ncbi:carbon monoxide dehydrogenase subunit G [Mycobacterium sp. KBS0706]|uniref:SRPBCC family protein n=1 Tax=Mycobacterium sp. KBS0706 TaxID=2578109 RepID=UPI00110F9D1E|nr:carbon monoxide dehydrogenase subunit G [Mycobacterium sp. KBS0706]TSD89029.1 carbon monoxide dehydrogenase subunit G [Mycobacterium sp. KBS0706]
MEMTGEHRIAAPRSVVWEGLNDPEVLRRSIPGCDTLEKTSPTEMTATVTAKVGPVKASFGGQVTLSNLNPPESYTISGEGKGGAAGFAKGGADVKLVEDGDGTLLQYAVKANIGGKLAQLGARLIDGTAKKMADDFFTRFAAEMEQRAAAAPVPAPTPAAEPVAPAAAEIPVPTPVPAETVVTPPSPAEAPSFATAEPIPAPQPVPAAEPAPKPAPAVAPSPRPAPPPVTEERRGGLSPAVWITALVVIVLVLLYLYL